MTFRAVLIRSAYYLAIMGMATAAHAQLSYTTNWLGNTLPGNDGTPPDTMQHVPLDMQGIYVTSDGSVYTNTGWDEGGRANSIFKNGQLISPNAGNGAGGQAIAVSGGYIFASQDSGTSNNPPCAAGGCGVAVLNSSTLQSAGSLSGDANVSSTGSPDIYGIAAFNGNVYVAIDNTNTVDVFSASSLSLVNTFSINDPVHIAIDSNGGMWVSHMDHTPLPNLNGTVYDLYGDFGLSTIDHYDSSGNHVNTITLPDNGEVSALWIDSNNNLYVGDEGPDQNIKIYTNILSTPTLSGTFGTQGGIYGSSNTGVVGTNLFRYITGIGTDSSGNIYVSDDGFGHGVLLSSFTPSGQLNWQVNALDFVSTGAVDPNSETDFYDAYHHFTLNYGNAPGNLGTYYSDTLDPFTYPQDVRITGVASTAQVQYIQGNKFLLVSNQSGSYLSIYRFNPGSEIAIPCAAFDYGTFNDQYNDFAVQPTDGEFIWRDVNGDGQMELNEFEEPPNNTHRDGQDFWMDSNGDVWQVNYYAPSENSIHIRRYLFQGFDQYGAPIYNYNNMDIYNQSTDFPDVTDVSRVIFQPGESDGGTLYVAGSSNGNGSFTQVARYDHWDQGNRTATWVANIPNSSTITPNSISEVGNYFFIDYNTPHYISVYSTADGSYVGEIDPGTNVGGTNDVGNDDEWQSTSAYLRSNGQYVITKEEDYQAKQLLYVWTPPGVEPQASAPTFSPAGGTYTSAQSVTISDSTSGATIYYTTDGTTPTTSSSVYSSPINVSSTVTIEAIATASGYSTSPVSSTTYTISSSSGSESPYNGPHNLPGTVQAEDYDTGGQGVAYNQTVSGGQTGYRSDNSGAVEANSADSNGWDLGWTAAGQWYNYTVNVSSAGSYTVSFVVASPSGQSSAFHLNNSSGNNLSGEINVPNTGGWYTWQTVTATVTLSAGTQTLQIVQDNGNWNLDDFSFASASSGPAVEINAGGPAVSGTNWVADTDVSGGTGESWTNSINTSNVTNPAPTAVYQTDHFAYNVSSFTYTIPNLTPNASYTVRLHFCENFWTAAGQRVFNVSINGTQVLTNFDVFQTAGGQSIANIQQFSAAANANGQIAIVFTSVTDNAEVNGIEVDQ